jgi:hypothetical protein
MSFREGLYSGSSVNKEEEATDMDFLVERSLREVLDTAETYMWLGGFHVSLSERTETTSLFY